MAENKNRLIVATRNQGKVREFARWFEQKGFTVQSLSDYDDVPEVVEDGTTFEANATKKAKTVAHYLGKTVLADDSGLNVDELNGAPGVYSARFAGEHASDADNNDKLVLELTKKMGSPRTVHTRGGSLEVLSAARFVCVLAVYDPAAQQLLTADGYLEGYIIAEASGKNGFGYDPYFYVPELGKTLAECSMDEKNKISHRSKALANLRRINEDKEWFRNG